MLEGWETGLRCRTCDIRWKSHEYRKLFLSIIAVRVMTKRKDENDGKSDYRGIVRTV